MSSPSIVRIIVFSQTTYFYLRTDSTLTKAYFSSYVYMHQSCTCCSGNILCLHVFPYPSLKKIPTVAKKIMFSYVWSSVLGRYKLRKSLQLHCVSSFLELLLIAIVAFLFARMLLRSHVLLCRQCPSLHDQHVFFHVIDRKDRGRHTKCHIRVI